MADARHHLADARVVAVQVRRTKQLAGETALRHARERALRRIARDFLGDVVVGDVGGEDMREELLFRERDDTARLALMEMEVRRLLARLRLLRADAQDTRLRMVEEEVSELLERVGEVRGLGLVDDRANVLRRGQDAHVSVERRDELAARAAKARTIPVAARAVEAGTVAVLTTRRTVTVPARAVETRTVALFATRSLEARTIPVIAAWAVEARAVAVAARRAFLAALKMGVARLVVGLALRPVGGEVKGAKTAEIERAFRFLFFIFVCHLRAFRESRQVLM